MVRSCSLLLDRDCESRTAATPLLALAIPCARGSQALRRAIAQVETPRATAATYSPALTILRAWKQDILTVVLDMGADPEPAALLSSILRSLLSHLIRRDSLFADEVVHLESVANTKTHCSDGNLLTLIAQLEIELSSRAFSEQSPATTAMRGGRVRRIHPQALP